MAYLTLLANHRTRSASRGCQQPRRGIGRRRSRACSRRRDARQPSGRWRWAERYRLGKAQSPRSALHGRDGELRALARAVPCRAARDDTSAQRIPRLARGRAHVRGAGRIENLEEWSASARVRCERGAGGLDAFLEQVALVSDADARVDDQGPHADDAAQAKGSIPDVFIIGCGRASPTRDRYDGLARGGPALCYVG